MFSLKCDLDAKKELIMDRLCDRGDFNFRCDRKGALSYVKVNLVVVR